jgi:hypothetical protein
MLPSHSPARPPHANPHQHHPPLPQAVFGPGGVLEGLTTGKGYVDMSTVDEQTSTKIAEAVVAKGGRFLEVGQFTKVTKCTLTTTPYTRLYKMQHCLREVVAGQSSGQSTTIQHPSTCALDPGSVPGSVFRTTMVHGLGLRAFGAARPRGAASWRWGLPSQGCCHG